MSASILSALIRKDVSLMLRNRFFAVVLVLGLVVYIGVYFAMPAQVEEELTLGLVSDLSPDITQELGAAEGLAFIGYSSAAAIISDIENGLLPGGLELPRGFMDSLQSGQPVTASVYVSSDAPEEYRGALNLLLSELAYQLAGKPLNIDIQTTVLGRDTTGAPVAPRDALLPLFAVFILLTEMMSLASLLSEEIETRTIRALLVTPLNLKGLFLAKGITGTSMAFLQAIIFLAVVGGLAHQPLLVVTIILLGAMMATGVGFLVASGGRDLMSVMAWGVLLMLVFSVPAFGVIFPGSTGNWSQVIPSYYLVDALNQVISYSAGWNDVWPSLAWIAGFNAAFIGLGMLALRRKLG